MKVFSFLLTFLFIFILGYFSLTFLPDLLKPNDGELNVTTSSRSAEVFLDGKNLGKTPYFGKNLKIGTHLVKIQPLDGQGSFSWQENVNLASQVVTTLNVELAPSELFSSADNLSFTSGGTGISLLTHPEKVSVNIDGQDYGTTPQTINLKKGVHVLNLKKPGYLTRSVNINIETGFRVSGVFYLAADPFPTIQKIETTNKLSLFAIFNSNLKLGNSFSNWAAGLNFIQDSLNPSETRFDYLIDKNGKTYILNQTSWENKLVSASPANIGFLMGSSTDTLSGKAKAEWDKLKTLFP